MPAPRNALKHALAEGKMQIGLWNSFASPTASEIVGQAGYDWVLVDAEHTPNSVASLQMQLQAMNGAPSTPIVRVPVGEDATLKRVLDIGAQSVLVPMVHTSEQAAAMVRAVRYPPHGIRGVGAGMARASGYGAESDYATTANDEICLIVQAESRMAIDNIDAIAWTEGVDVVFIGPADLSADMGHLGTVDHPDVLKTIEEAGGRIRAAGKAAGILTFDTTMIKPFADMGFTFLGVGGDLALYADAVRRRAQDARAALTAQNIGG